MQRTINRALSSSGQRRVEHGDLICAESHDCDTCKPEKSQKLKGGAVDRRSSGASRIAGTIRDHAAKPGRPHAEMCALLVAFPRLSFPSQRHDIRGRAPDPAIPLGTYDRRY